MFLEFCITATISLQSILLFVLQFTFILLFDLVNLILFVWFDFYTGFWFSDSGDTNCNISGVKTKHLSNDDISWKIYGFSESVVLKGQKIKLIWCYLKFLEVSRWFFLISNVLQIEFLVVFLGVNCFHSTCRMEKGERRSGLPFSFIQKPFWIL